MRSANGLALSSKNARLTPQELPFAAEIYRALQQAECLCQKGECHGERLRNAVREHIAQFTALRLSYVSIAEPHTLEEIEFVTAPTLLSTAVFLGEIRLIDNLVLTPV